MYLKKCIILEITAMFGGYTTKHYSIYHALNILFYLMFEGNINEHLFHLQQKLATKIDSPLSYLIFAMIRMDILEKAYI